MRKGLLLIGIGLMNVLHGFIHFFQFIQSMILVSYGVNHDETGWVYTLLENPAFNLFWALIGIITLIIGYKDFKYHNHKH